MLTLNPNSLGSYALRNGCSYFGGRPFNSVLTGQGGELVFMFKPNHFGNEFFQWIRINFDAKNYSEIQLTWKGQSFNSVFLKIPQNIRSKFLLPFYQFSKRSFHLITFFN